MTGRIDGGALRGQARLMDGMRVCIDVEDVERAAAFYAEAFGLRRGRKLGSSWVEMVGGAVPIDLLGTRAGSSATPAGTRRSFERHWTPVHVDVIVADVEEAVTRATRAGATLDREIQERPYGRLANLSDPFGNGFCLIQMSAAGYDALLAEPEEIET